MKVKVLNRFVDKDDFSKEYKPGDVVETFDEARISFLVEKGLVEHEDKKESKVEKTEDKKESKKEDKKESK